MVKRRIYSHTWLHTCYIFISSKNNNNNVQFYNREYRTTHNIIFILNSQKLFLLCFICIHVVSWVSITNKLWFSVKVRASESSGIFKYQNYNFKSFKVHRKKIEISD